MASPARTFDAIIIGAGQAGPPLATRLTAAGMKVCLIERKLVGGTCVNTGCMPTKALIASARVAHVVRGGAAFGVRTGTMEFDMAAAAARARKVSDEARIASESRLEAMSGLTFIRGHARLAGPTTVMVGNDTLRAARIFLNVGGRASIPPIAGVDDVPYLDNTDMVGLDYVPAHLIVVGGGPVGLEFAQMYRRFGARVTLIERNRRIAMREDADIAAAISGMLEAEGIEIRTSADCVRLDRDAAGIAVTVICARGDPVVRGSNVLMATGRKPNTDDLGLDAAGVAIDERGYIRVNDRLESSQKGIWALGECNGRGAFTHTAYNDFEIVAANLLDGEDRSLSSRVEGYAIYTDPPLGRVGMTQAEAIAAGRDILVSIRLMANVGRAVEKGETIGLMKLVADAGSRRIIGAAIFGVDGDEAIHAVLNLMSADATVDDLRWAVPIHPTTAELLPTLAAELHGPGAPAG